MKLNESIPSNGVKIIELYNKIISDILIVPSGSQRKLVWKKQHKYYFIETILMNYPFPEVYIASAEINVDQLTASEMVVDGRQRLSAIVDYIKGANDFKDQKRIPSFDSLSIEEKKNFLNYLVAVRDLKDMDEKSIKEVFQRINSTEYALNKMELKNAEFGDGEFAVFCKQVIDLDYNPSEMETDIILPMQQREKLYHFFVDNGVFSDNDRARMFDLQYIMLIVSTLLEGDYYGRSSKVPDYMANYNDVFEEYGQPLNELVNAVDIISNLGFEKESYWFNQANLFTLIIELARLEQRELNKLDIRSLEVKLREMENKVDDYFNAVSVEDIDRISVDEQKYFEVARQGSHEKSARQHRGKVISGIIKSSLKTDNVIVSPETKRKQILDDLGLSYGILIPTLTGLNKSIMDAITPLKEFLRDNNIHDYAAQEKGPKNKVIKSAMMLTSDGPIETEISMYRANHRGDARIWIKSLPNYTQPNDTIAIISKVGRLWVVNLSKIEIENLRLENILL